MSTAIEHLKERTKTCMGNNGVWVMGVGEPVKVLNGEFTYINE